MPIESSVNLAQVVGVVLALASSSCCLGVENEDRSGDFVGMISGDELDELRADNTGSDARCRAACVEIGSDDYGDDSFSTGDVTNCEATAPMMEDGGHENPWDASYTEVVVTCSAEWTYIPFCTGRRPLGHREAELAVDSLGAWFAVNAHLEQASVTAFAELAAWLAKRGAPPELTERCEAARADEIVHAERMRVEARRAGADVPAVEADALPCALFEVALHNAVEGCVSEAFAALIAGYQARHADAPEHRALFETIASDELRHGQLAWDLHAWLVPQLSEAQRDAVIAAQARALARLPSAARESAGLTPTELGWPAPSLAADMAKRFAALVSAEPRESSASRARARC